MSEVEIGSVESMIEFEDSQTSTPVPQPGELAAAGAENDQARLRELLRPILLELLEDELNNYTRMRG